MPGTDVTSPSGPAATPDPPPQRVSTLELFFNLVFVFTITQLTSTLAKDVTLAAVGRLLLIFGVLWWMYGGYAWLTNARSPSRTPERLLLLLGMAGFLVIGLSIPHAFGAPGTHGSDGLALGLALTASLWWLKNAIGHPDATLPAGPAIALAGGVTLFLAGDVAFRQVLGIGAPWCRALAAALALAAWPLSVAVNAAAGIALLTAVVAGALAVEGRAWHATVKA